MSNDFSSVFVQTVYTHFNDDIDEFRKWFAKNTGKHVDDADDARKAIAHDLDKVRERIGHTDLKDKVAMKGLMWRGRHLSKLYQKTEIPIGLGNFWVYDPAVLDLHEFTLSDLAVVNRIINDRAEAVNTSTY